MDRLSLAALAVMATLGAAVPVDAGAVIEDHWVEAGRTKVIPIDFQGGSRLVIVEGDGTLVEYCLAGQDGKIVHCGRGHLKIEISVPEGRSRYELRVENAGLLAGNFRIIVI